MADKKQFNFEDWMAMRKEQLPSIMSPYRKKFDLTPNSWMEDPGIWSRAKKAAELDPSFAKQLGMNANNPLFTEQFISRLDELVPQVPFEEIEKTARSEAASDLSNILKNRAYSLEKSPTPATLLPEQARPFTPKLAGASALNIQKGIEDYEVGKKLASELPGLEKAAAKDRVIENLMRSSMSTEPSKFSTYADIEKNIPIAREAAKQQAELAAQAAKAEAAAQKAAELKKSINLTGEFDVLNPVFESLSEELGRTPTGREVLEALAKTGLKGGSKALELGGKVLTSPPVKMLGKAIPPVVTLAEGARAAGNIKRGEYTDALSNILGASSGVATMMASPYAMPLAAGSLGLAGGKELGKQQAELAGEGIFYDPSSGMSRSEEELPESVRKAPMGTEDLIPLPKIEKKQKPEFEFDTEPSDLDKSLDEEYNKSVEFQEQPGFTPSNETLEEPTPSPTPTEEGQKTSSTLGNKLMDLFGMPSAYAEEMPQTTAPQAKPAQAKVPQEKAPKQVKVNVPKHLIKNIVYSEALKNKIPPSFLLGVIGHESDDFNLDNPNVIKNSESTSRGIGQITEGTFSDIQKMFPYFKDKRHKDLSDMSNASSVRDQVRATIAVLQLKAKKLKIPFTPENLRNPQVQDALLKGYYGNENPKLNDEYASNVRSKINAYDTMLSQFNKDRRQQKMVENEIAIPDWLDTALKVDKGISKILPATMFSRNMLYQGVPFLLEKMGVDVPSLVSETKYQQDKKLAKNVGTLPFASEGKDIQFVTKEQQAEIEKENEDIAKELEDSSATPEEDDTGAAIDLIKRLQEEGDSDKSMKLMAMQNLLRAQSMTPILKGMALMASGAIGGAKKFAVSPKLEGMETFDQLERAPASMLAMQDMLAKDKYDDPNSAVSEAYRRYAGEIFKKIDPEFNDSKLAGLSANSVKTLMPLGIKEDTLLMRKLAAEGRKEKEAETTALKQAKENRLLQKDVVAKFDRDTKDEKIKINGAIQAKALIKKIKDTNPKDRLTASKNMRQTLTLEALRLATPAGLNVLAGDRAAAAIDTLYGDIKDKIGYLFSMPTETITDQYLDQLSAEIDLLQNKYKEFFVKKTNGILKAYDHPVQQKAIKSLAQQYAPDVYGEKEETAPATISAGEEMVKVKSPDGRVGRMPRSKFEEAVKNGLNFTEIK